MEITRDLSFRGSKTAIAGFIANLEARLKDGWSRDEAREDKAHAVALGMYCFCCAASGRRIAAELWIATRRDGLYVGNVLPVGQPSLLIEEYNAIVQEFHDKFALPAAQATGVDVELGAAEFRIGEFLSASTQNILYGLARDRRRTYRLDRARWNQFLTAAHREGASLSGSDFYRWLVEEVNWPEDEARTLSDEYEHARELLGVFESQAS